MQDADLAGDVGMAAAGPVPAMPLTASPPAGPGLAETRRCCSPASRSGSATVMPSSAPGMPGAVLTRMMVCPGRWHRFGRVVVGYLPMMASVTARHSDVSLPSRQGDAALPVLVEPKGRPAAGLGGTPGP